MNIIIIGCGKIGQKLAEQLNQEDDINITVVDLKYNIVKDTMDRFDVMGVVGSGTSIDTLLEAGIKTADILIAVTGSDETNLLTCLLAKKAGNCGTVARVSKPEHNRGLGIIKDDLGLAMMINPEQTAANEIARILRFPSAIQIDTFAKGRVEILKFRVSENSVLDNLVIADIRQKLNGDVLVCGVERENSAFIPGGDFVLRSGDRVSILAATSKASEFFKKIGVKTDRVKDATIVGGSATAYYLAEKLIQSGIQMKIIDKDAKRCDELCQLLPKATIINADGTENRVLLEEGIEYAQSFVAMTNIDEENIMLSLYAKSKMNGKLITKINRIEYDDVIGNLDLDTVIYPKNIVAEYIVRFVRAKKNSMGSNIETMHLILDGKAEALEFRIREDLPFIGVKLEDLKLKKNVLIACINRGGNVIIPRGKDSVAKDDTVIVVTTISGLKDIRDILE